MVHDFLMDMEVSPNIGQANHEENGLKLDRLSALLLLATDSNVTISAHAVDELCKLDRHSVEFIANDILELTNSEMVQSSREKIFRLLVPYHHILPSLSTALTLELLGTERAQDLALELLPLLSNTSLGAVPILVHLANEFPISEKERCERFLECAGRISPLTDTFISQFAPELPHHNISRAQLPTELEICGRLVLSNDHDFFSSPLKELLELSDVQEVIVAPTPIFILLGRDLSQLPFVTQMAALRVASLAPAISQVFGKRVADVIRENSPAIVRQCGLYMLMNIIPHEFSNFSGDFENLLFSEHEFGALCASLTVRSVSHTLSPDEQLFLIDSLLRACQEGSISRYKNILFCMESLDAEQTIPHLFKLFLNAPSTDYENTTKATIQRVKDSIPGNRRSAVLGRVRRDLELELPSFNSFIKTILG